MAEMSRTEMEGRGEQVDESERRVVGRGWVVVDGVRREVLLFRDGGWDVSEGWKRVFLDQKHAARRDAGGRAGAKRTLVVEEARSRSAMELQREKGKERATDESDSSGTSRKSRYAESKTDSEWNGGVSLESSHRGGRNREGQARPTLRGGSGRRGLSSGMVGEMLDAFDRVRSAKASKKHTAQGSGPEPLLQRPSAVTGEETPRQAERLLSVKESRSIETYNEAWPNPAESARPIDWAFVDNDEFDVLAQPIEHQSPWSQLRQKGPTEEAPALAIQATYDRLREQESMRLGVSVIEGNEQLAVLNAIRERLTEDGSEADMSPSIRAAVPDLVDEKIETRKSKADAEEEWDLVEDEDAKRISAPNANNLKRLWDCRAYDTAWRGV